jgi:hypothetical protein
VGLTWIYRVTLEATDADQGHEEAVMSRADSERPPADLSSEWGNLSGDWNVCLEDGDQPDSAPPAPPRWARAALGIVTGLVAVLCLIWLRPLVDPQEAPARVIPVVGTRLAAPVALPLPEGAIVTADDAYVGVRLADGALLVTVPTQVADPVSGRQPMPADPASWLERHPAVFVSRVREVDVAGVSATQVDYRRSGQAQPSSRYAGLSLFCGWKSDSLSVRPFSGSSAMPACTRITSNAWVRATFVPVGGRIVLLEAVWRIDQGPGWPMPADLRRSYDALLAGLAQGPNPPA